MDQISAIKCTLAFLNTITLHTPTSTNCTASGQFAQLEAHPGLQLQNLNAAEVPPQYQHHKAHACNMIKKILG